MNNIFLGSMIMMRAPWGKGIILFTTDKLAECREPWIIVQREFLKSVEKKEGDQFS